MTLCLVQVGRVSDAGENLFDVMDGHSSEMAEYHAAFFKPNGWDYKESMRRQFPDILSLDPKRKSNPACSLRDISV